MRTENWSKFLFLDVDGVLNTAPDRIGSINDAKLRLVFEIHKQTGCGVVIISSWRYTTHQLQRIIGSLLREISSDYISCVPVIQSLDGLALNNRKTIEILDWFVLARNANESNSVILDDYVFPGALGRMQISISSDTGLNESIASKVIQKFHAESKED